MSSISALGSNQSTYTSPLQQLEAELQSEVSAGTVSSSDESALSSALTSINSSLTAGQSSGSTDAGGNAGPGDIRSKIDSLIQAQVSSGALTSSQATELQNLFSNTFGNGQGGRVAVVVRVDLAAPEVPKVDLLPDRRRPAPVQAARLRTARVRRSINCSIVRLQAVPRPPIVRRRTALRRATSCRIS